MNLPFFASFMIFIIWLTHQLSKHKRNEREMVRAYWEKESLANRTRRKPLDTLPYIVIPVRSLPMEVLTEDETIRGCLEDIRFLAEQKIVNLTGITNTDLKLEYGAPNLPVLMQYDQNYTKLARTLQKWAQRLFEQDYPGEALTVLEFAVSTGTDVSSTYALLGRLYADRGRTEEIQELIARAGELRSASRPRILRILQELSPYNGSPDSL